MEKKRRRGGQRKPAALRKRKSLTFRIRDRMRAVLKEAAADNERSISEEVEHRLMMSFLNEDIVEKLDQTNTLLETTLRAFRTTAGILFKQSANDIPACGSDSAPSSERR